MMCDFMYRDGYLYKKIVAVHTHSMAKNSTINNHRTDMEPVYYALCSAAVAAAAAVIVVHCMALPLRG